jgi:acetyltransferase-like isoleucine patch superfamily enzyme
VTGSDPPGSHPADAPVIPQHGSAYSRVEAVTPSWVKTSVKRVVKRGRRSYNRLRYLERGRFVEIGRMFRYDRSPPFATRIGERTIVEEANVWNARHGDIVVGSRCWIGLNNIVMGPVAIGDDVSTGQNVSILGPRTPSPAIGRTPRERTVIGSNVWISNGAIVHFGVEIGDNAVISAGAVVSEDVPANSLCVQTVETTYVPLAETQIRKPGT